MQTAHGEVGIKMELAAREYGMPVPQAVMSFPANYPYRMARVVMFQLAAAIEELSLLEDWGVNVGHITHEGRGLSAGRVWIELAGASMDEANRGVAVMGRAASKLMKPAK